MGGFHRERAEEAMVLMRSSGVDAVLLFPGADIGYFTGFTIEPGLYIVREIDVRVEDTVVCTDDGCECLTKHRRTLTSHSVRG